MMESHTSNMGDTHLGNIKTHPVLHVLKPYSSERGDCTKHRQY